MNNYLNNTRSMNGLNNINANSGTFEEIDVNTLVVNVSGTAPTPPLLDNSTNIATTAFVLSHTGGNYVDLTTNQTIVSGIKTFNTLPQSSAVPTLGDEFVNLNTLTNATSNLLSGANTWTGNTNTFNSYLPTSNISATLGDEFTNKTFVDGAISTSTSNLLSGANTWTGNTNTFNSYLPTSNISATLGDEFTNKTFVDGAISTATSNLLSGANAWIGNTNTFNSYLPTSTISATSANEFTNKTFVDGAISTSTSNLLSGANTWTGNTNTFNSYLPTSTISATTGNQFVNLTTLNSTISAGSFVTTNTTQTIAGAKTITTNTLKAEAGVTIKNGTGAQNATLTHNTTTLDIIGSGDISIKPTNDFNVLTGTGKNINISCPSTALLPSTQTFNTGITNTSSYIALESPTTYITGLSTQPNLIIAGASGTIYGLKFTRGGTTLAAINRINCSSTNDTFYLEVNSGTQITITNTAVTINPDDTFNMMPTATIISNVSSTVPSGFLYCNGQAVSRTVTYSRLFASIGTTYGVGDGSTTFNVPNFQGCFLRGAGNQTTGGVTYTAPAVGTIQQDAVLTPLYASNEGFRDAAAGARECVSRDRIVADPVDTNTGILPRFDRTATENRPVNHAVYYYIRY